MTRHGPARTVALASATVVALSGCGSPAPDRFDHHDAVVTAVESALGDTRTAALAAQAWRAGDATTAYAAVVLRESAAGVDGAGAALDGLTPPASGDRLQDRALQTISRAADAVVAARVAVERDERDAAPQLVAAVVEASDELARLDEELG